MKKLITLIIALTLGLYIYTCTNPTLTKYILISQGYKNIKTHGFGFFQCSRDDWSSTKFIAFKNGRQISGVVCCGIFKNCTIRYNY